MGDEVKELRVRLSYELVQLLSEQLYQSPLKAIEELVVNAYDADAKVCAVQIPDPERSWIAVYDDGVGMDVAGMEELWHIGRSNKRSDAIAKARSRKQIGKFGIGKLATYAIANRITHISKTREGLHVVTVDFRKFQKDAEGAGSAVDLPVRNRPRRVRTHGQSDSGGRDD